MVRKESKMGGLNGAQIRRGIKFGPEKHFQKVIHTRSPDGRNGTFDIYMLYSVILIRILARKPDLCNSRQEQAETLGSLTIPSQAIEQQQQQNT